jgi:hypothetical protein
MFELRCSEFELFCSESAAKPLWSSLDLDSVAKQYGFTSEEFDKAIRACGTKTTDPYDVGLAALYARNHDAATSSLKDSLKQREEKLVADHRTLSNEGTESKLQFSQSEIRSRVRDQEG